jgi:murein DD-endopeptidase MepM/ murein hydrolase activator NlpD
MEPRFCSFTRGMGKGAPRCAPTLKAPATWADTGTLVSRDPGVVVRVFRRFRLALAAAIASVVLIGAVGPAAASEVGDAVRAQTRVDRRIVRLTRLARIRGRELRRAVVVAERDADARPGLQTLSALHAAQRVERGFGRWVASTVRSLRVRHDELEAWLYSWGIFRVCPVDGPRYIHDDFGEIVNVGDAPPHVHRGSDIEAPVWTPIRAPFDGYAWGSSSNFGGYQVRVRGDRGYVFIAHLIGYGDLGWVDAGTTVGYVGSTGLSTAPHAHVEWHPWGGGAVDPHDLLTLACD